MHPAVEKFKAIGEPTRLRTLRILADAGKELCVCEIAEALRKPLYTVSKSLTILRHAGLVEERRDGKFMMYRLRPGALNDRLFAALEQLPPEDPLYREDIPALRRRFEARGARRLATLVGDGT